MKKKTGMTYDSLMNHFVNYPNHPEWLHKMFSPLSVMLVSTILIIFLGYVIFNINLGLCCILAIIMLYVFSRSVSMMREMSGHGVGLNPKHILRARKILFISVILLGTIIGLALVSGFYAYCKDGNILFILLPTILAWNLVGSIFIWKYHMYYITWYGDEYDARVEFKNKSMSDQEIDTAIKVLRINGILPASSERG